MFELTVLLVVPMLPGPSLFQVTVSLRATPEGKVKLMADLIYTEEERPIVAQLLLAMKNIWKRPRPCVWN